MPLAALVDVDGTLVDTNYHHALAWYRAFRRYDLIVATWRIHRHIGMGGDQLVPAVAGDEVERRHGDALREAWVDEFEPMLAEVAPVEGAHDFLAGLREQGARVVLASSGKPQHTEAFVDLVGARDVVEAWTTSEDVEATKPEPELLEVALGKLGAPRPEPADVVVVGDSTWDCVAAGRLGVSSVALRTGGFPVDELRAAGAAEVLDSLGEVADFLRTRAWRR